MKNILFKVKYVWINSNSFACRVEKYEVKRFLFVKKRTLLETFYYAEIDYALAMLKKLTKQTSFKIDVDYKI